MNLETLDSPIYKGSVAAKAEQTMVVGEVTFYHY
jgi:hypothetical protein